MMELVSIPSIMIISYLVTEIFKLWIKKKKYLPLVAGISGLILGIIIYYIEPDILNTSNIFTSMAKGIISGLASTGSNEIIKQMRKEE